MTSWASVPRPCALPADLPATPTAPLAVRSAALSVTGTLLAASAAAWTLPMLWPDAAQAQVRTQAQVPSQQGEQPSPLLPAPPTASNARTVAFDYSADVAPNDVYDGARAEAPLPLFRALGDRVDVSAVYSGPAAHVRLVARLSSTTGWTTTVPLASEVRIDGRGRVRATLELRQLEERAARVARQTEMPFEGMTVELVAAVRDDSGTWTPSVALQLSTQQLRLVGEPSTLVVQDASASAPGGATPSAPTPASRLDDLLGWRPDGMLTSLALTLGVAGGVVVLRRRRREDDADQARRRLGRLLLEVRPPDLSGVRVVEVGSPDALARLAERYGLLVLHWTDDAGAVFVVQDEATAYRWTVGAQDDRVASQAEQSQQAEQSRQAERPQDVEQSQQAEQAEQFQPTQHSQPLVRTASALPAHHDVRAERPGDRGAGAPAPELPARAPGATEPDALTALALLLLAETRETAAATAAEAAEREQAERRRGERQRAGREQVARDEVGRQEADSAARLEAARREVVRLEAEQLEAARKEQERREAARLEESRQEAARREAERRRHLEAAERARAEADRAQQARVEAERLERRRRAEAVEALAALERAEQRAAQEQRLAAHGPQHRPEQHRPEQQRLQRPLTESVRAAVPAPRDGDRPLPVRPVDAWSRSEEQLDDGPPREADERPRPPSSFFEVG